MQVQVGGEVYEVPSRDLQAMLAAFDVWRDGKGRLVGDAWRQAFLHVTSEISLRIWHGTRREFDTYGPVRYRNALRSVVASRPRGSKEREPKKQALLSSVSLQPVSLQLSLGFD